MLMLSSRFFTDVLQLSNDEEDRVKPHFILKKSKEIFQIPDNQISVGWSGEYCETQEFITLSTEVHILNYHSSTREDCERSKTFEEYVANQVAKIREHKRQERFDEMWRQQTSTIQIITYDEDPTCITICHGPVEQDSPTNDFDPNEILTYQQFLDREAQKKEEIKQEKIKRNKHHERARNIQRRAQSSKEDRGLFNQYVREHGLKLGQWVSFVNHDLLTVQIFESFQDAYQIYQNHPQNQNIPRDDYDSDDEKVVDEPQQNSEAWFCDEYLNEAPTEKELSEFKEEFERLERLRTTIKKDAKIGQFLGLICYFTVPEHYQASRTDSNPFPWTIIKGKGLSNSYQLQYGRKIEAIELILNDNELMRLLIRYVSMDHNEFETQFTHQYPDIMNRSWLFDLLIHLAW